MSTLDNDIIFECYVDSENLDKVKFDIVKINPSIDWSITHEKSDRFRIILFKKDGFIDYTPNYFE